MRADLHNKVVGLRAADLRAIFLPYILANTGVLIVLGFGGSGLEHSGVQLALAAFVVLGSLWVLLWTDGCIADIAAGAKDMDEEMAASHMGQNWAKAPFGMFRVIGPVFTVLLLITELMALYA